jgi:hypothetical protein
MTRHNDVHFNEIPEVAEFEQAREAVEAFRRAYPQVFEQYGELVDIYNSRLEAADKVVRSREVSCGSWELYQKQTTYDADALYDALGMEKFMAVGGTLNTVTKRDIDKTKFKAAIARNDVPPEVVESISKISPRYHAPKKLGA